ncbi:MAG: DUF3024 domain-containing protein [Guyparkeria sp.]|uniref:DUF3024 domain-containing protein n=1 Tax=Guyparkeria sp. TaxID=2035736 RepID=UPI00397CF86F
MAFSEIDRRRVEKQVTEFVEARRPPVDLRVQMDIGFHVEGQAVELFERRRSMRGHRIEEPFARFVHVRSRSVWKLYWMRMDGRWQRYLPLPEAERLEDLLEEVDEDPNACFFG